MRCWLAGAVQWELMSGSLMRGVDDGIMQVHAKWHSMRQDWAWLPESNGMDL
jgi:hypothetical protein